MKAYFYFNDKETQTYNPQVTVEGNLTTVRIPRCDLLGMGINDLGCATDEELKESVKAIKQAWDEFESMKHLQYEFMEKHEKLGNNRYRTTYSDGTVITADYNTNECIVEKGDK